MICDPFCCGFFFFGHGAGTFQVEQQYRDICRGNPFHPRGLSNRGRAQFGQLLARFPRKIVRLMLVIVRRYLFIVQPGSPFYGLFLLGDVAGILDPAFQFVQGAGR